MIADERGHGTRRRRSSGPACRRSAGARRRARGRPGRARGGLPDDAHARRGEALPARPLHAGRAGGALPSLADGPARGRGAVLPGDRAARAHLHCDGDARGAVGAPRRRRLPPRARASRRRGAMTAPRLARAGENGRLSLAVPAKGRMSEPALRLCADAGLSFETTERSLLVPCANAPVDLLLVRPSDIPEYVQDGVVDAGITGANLVLEAAADVQTLAELGFARCTLEAAAPEDSDVGGIDDLTGLRVATAYPTTTRRLLDERGVRAELVPVSGSVEAAPRLGL